MDDRTAFRSTLSGPDSLVAELYLPGIVLCHLKVSLTVLGFKYMHANLSNT